MFKPLLRTLPSLSGNFTIGCKLNEITKDEVNEYSTYIRVANLMPLQNHIYSKSIELNLLKGKYEYDLKKFYYLYSNLFYKTNYQYNKNNYKLLDLDSQFDNDSDDRNKDYEFGCKRISYSQNEYQFIFYAPIYVDDVNDLPEYFCINLQFNDHHIKTIKVYINKDNKLNYLKRYLSEYLNKIDDQVIFCLPDSLQATYFGIDVKNGGLTQYKDNVIGNIYINQTTINNFDNTICEGFERNKLVMRQIIPLSFVFNINDLLNDYEKKFFEGYKINVSGYYKSKYDNAYKFYDFDLDYSLAYQMYNKYNSKSGSYNINNGTDDKNDFINVMDVSYPSINESKYTEYAFTNKLTPKYCKFKMMLSSDDDPYITNLSFGYSYLQYPNQKYGYFPTMFKGVNPECVIVNDDLKIPVGVNIGTYYKTSKYFANNVYIDSMNYDKYNKLMTNYYSSWFNIYDINSYEDIENIISNDSYWKDVIHDYSYFKGILYNLTELSNYNIDKFGVFISYNFNYINKKELNTKLIKAKYVFSHNDASEYKIGAYADIYNMNITNHKYIISSTSYYNKLFDCAQYNLTDYLLYDKIMKEDIEGTYIKEENYIEESTYYNYDEVANAIKSFDEDLYNQIYNELLNVKITGYLLINAFNNINFFETYYDANKVLQYRFMLTHELFSNNEAINRFNWLYDKLYVSTVRSTSKELLKNIYDKIDQNEDIYGKICVFLKNSYINKGDLINIILNCSYIDNEKFEKVIYQIKNLTPYIYERFGNINGVNIEHYFIEYKDNKFTNIYVDPYNLSKLINIHNYTNNKNIKLPNEKKEFYIKLLDKDHLKEYYYKINKDENCVSPIEFDNIFDCLYVKKRNWVIDENILDIKDKYITLREFITKGELVYDKNDSENIQAFIINFNNMLNANNDRTIFNWLLENISDTRSNNDKFKLNLFGNYYIEFDLYIKKDLYTLDENLYKLMINDLNDVNNYLYLYIKNDDALTNFDTWTIINNNELFANNVIYKNIDESLIPLFSNVYINDYDTNIIKQMVINNKISNYKYIYNDDYYFKEINVLETLYSLASNELINSIFQNHQLNKLWYKYVNDNNIDLINGTVNVKNKKIDYLKSYYVEYYHELINALNIKLYSISDVLSVSLENNNIKNENLIYDPIYNMYIIKKDNTTYGFYIINFNIDNTNNSFNIKDDYNLNVQFNSINNRNIDKYGKSYFNSIFYLLMPFLKINIFSEFSKKVNTICYPRENEIVIKYGNIKLVEEEYDKYRMLIDKDSDILYSNITQLVNDKKIKLLRYFNYITPYLKETSNIKNVWVHKFITYDNKYIDISKYNIFIKHDINIYKYTPLNVYYGIYDSLHQLYLNDSIYDYHEEVNQIEYKHFNDNIIFNLPEEIIYNDDKEYYGKDIKSLIENDEKMIEKKKQILLKYFSKNKIDYSNIILFLFNKYESSFYINKTHSSPLSENNKFKISYKFKLV